MVNKIESVLSEKHITEQGIKSGFIRRSSKISAVKFLDLLLYNSSHDQCLSLNRLSIDAISQCGVDISKQGLDQRMNASAVKFIKGLLQKQLMDQVSASLDISNVKQFNRVCIKDSTKFDIHEQLADWLPGFGGCASKASACIQYEFDLRNGQIIDLDITPGNKPDVKYAQEKNGNVKKNDLVIQDLGYFSLESLSNIQKQEAYYISRLNLKTIVYEEIGGVLKELDFGKLYREIEKNGITGLEKQVLMGRNDKLAVRLVIQRVPDKIFEQRIRKIKAYNHKKGRTTSTDYINRARFNLFVTNAGQEMLESKTIPLIYKVRWQVELIFKVWKSTYGIHVTRKMKIERFLCLLYSKLLLIMVNWEIIMAFRRNIYTQTGHYLSIDKCFKTLKDNVAKLRDVLNKERVSAEEFIDWIGKIFTTKHWLEKRKNKIGYEEIMSLIC